jgi:type 1 glutamine amidotransferase
MLRLSSVDGRSAGELLVVGQGANQETVTIDRVVAGAGPSDPNVALLTKLARDHTPASPVFVTYKTIAVQIDSEPPVAEWPAIVDNRVSQAQTLTPTLSDPNGSGGVGIWRMEVDGAHVYPFPIALNTLTTGRHTQAVTLRDIAGNSITYTRVFVVTTSFADLDAVLKQYADYSLSSTLAAPAAAGDTGLRLAVPFGFRVGQTLLIGDGDTRETAIVASVPSPPPPQQGSNVMLTTPLKQAHGVMTLVSNPRPRVAAEVVTRLRAIVRQASETSTDKTAAIDLLKQFNAAVQRELPGESKAIERAALTSAGQSIIDELQGKSAPAISEALTKKAEPPSLRVFTDPTPPVHTPNAGYKVLVSGETHAFRHEHVADTEAMVQKLGAANGFDVDIWDERTMNGPGRQIPSGVSLAISPFADLATLKQYKTVVLVSTVGRDPSATFKAGEYANFQAYIRGGGGVVAIHGATDAYQNVPWWVDLVGGGFSGHGGNVVGIQPDCMSCGEVELVTADPVHPSTIHLQKRFAIHDELYNTSRNPVELGLVHPLVYENEATLVGQINYNPGPLMNSDRHAMVWCRNFEGGRSFTSVIGHNWELTHDTWYQQMILKGIQTTAGVVPANCVTYAEVSDLVSAQQASGALTAAAAAALGGALARARAEYEHGNVSGALTELDQFNSLAQPSGAKAVVLQAKGKELVTWMKGLK